MAFIWALFNSIICHLAYADQSDNHRDEDTHNSHERSDSAHEEFQAMQAAERARTPGRA